MCPDLKLTGVAEGIEDEQQAETRRAMGCHEGRGYLYAKPLAPLQLKKWILASQITS